MNPPLDPADLADRLRRARAGDKQAQGEICDLMYERVKALARRRILSKLPAVSASDIAVSVFQSFCARLENGQFKNLKDDLWPLLARLTCNKVATAYRREQAQRRGGNFDRLPGDDAKVFSKMMSREADPAMVVESADLLEKLLELLPAWLRDVLLWRMQEGLSNAEIAAKADLSEWMVEKAFRTIRRTWEDFAQAEGWSDIYSR